MIHGAGYRRAIPLFIWLLDMDEEEDAERRIPLLLGVCEVIGLCVWSAELSGGSSSAREERGETRQSVYPFAT